MGPLSFIVLVLVIRFPDDAMTGELKGSDEGA